jgi:hypothetical protein
MKVVVVLVRVHHFNVLIKQSSIVRYYSSFSIELFIQILSLAEFLCQLRFINIICQQIYKNKQVNVNDVFFSDI